MGNRRGNADLTSRMTQQDVINIFEMANKGATNIALGKAYHCSDSSISRILHKTAWTEKQKLVWKIDEIPDLIELDETNSLPEKKVFIRRKNIEFEPGASDAQRYQNENGIEEPPPLMEVPDHIRDSLPEVENISSALRNKRLDIRDKLDHKELMLRLENVRTCFELLVDEFEKLCNFLDK